MFGQGSLMPSGTPGPTMKSLDQIEPRTPISSLPFTINSSGAYYLTKNITVSGSTAGITVSADNVVVDLKGFTLTGGGSGGVAGISIGSQKNVVVRNGIITNWNIGGISASGCSNAIFEKLLTTLGVVGTGLAAGTDCIIRDCISSYNGGGGFTSGDGCSLLNCVGTGNASPISVGGFSLGNSVTVLNCKATNNGSSSNAPGFRVVDNCLISHCTSSENFSGDGINTGKGCRVVDCTVAGNSGNGISIQNGGTIQGCTVRSNGANGIIGVNNCSFTGNTCDGNNTGNSSSNGGILANGTGSTIDSNSCTSNGNGGGIIALNNHNLIIRNSCSGNGFNYNIPGTSNGNAFGPVVDMSAGGAISNTNPWTNWIH